VISEGYDSIGFCEDSMETTMPWTEITRPQYRREELRYASDLTVNAGAKSCHWAAQKLATLLI